MNSTPPDSTDPDEIHPSESDPGLTQKQPQGLPLTQLLVSVQNVVEAEIAINAGADIVDFKDPTRGPLGKVEPQVWTAAAGLIPAAPSSDNEISYRAPLLSAALGEGTAGAESADQLPANFAFAKVGTSGIASIKQLRDLWNQTAANLPAGTELVAVAYADHAAAGTLPPEQIFSLAATFGIGRCLLDTYTKDGISSLTHLGVAGLVRLDEIAETRDLWWALGGSITLQDAGTLADLELQPSCFAVRGDVCNGSRSGPVVPARVESWVQQLKRFPTRLADS